MKELKCDVCGNTAKGVAASALGPVSFAYCQNCLKKHAEPYWMLVATLATVGNREEVAEWVKLIIDGTLEVYNKTLEELDKDVEKEIKEFENYMNYTE